MCGIESTESQMATSRAKREEGFKNSRPVRFISWGFGTLVGSMILLSLSSSAHSPVGVKFIFPSYCCQNEHCREAKEGEIVDTKGGYYLMPWKIFIAEHLVKDSPDGKIYVCANWYKGMRKPYFRCLFIPRVA